VVFEVLIDVCLRKLENPKSHQDHYSPSKVLSDMFTTLKVAKEQHRITSFFTMLTPHHRTLSKLD
jgi:hypothetical protein